MAEPGGSEEHSIGGGPVHRIVVGEVGLDIPIEVTEQLSPHRTPATPYQNRGPIGGKHIGVPAKRHHILIIKGIYDVILVERMDNLHISLTILIAQVLAAHG